MLLATTIVHPYGWAAVVLLWIVLVLLLEFGYRQLMRMEARNRRKWWARQIPERRGIRIFVLGIAALVSLFRQSPATIYILSGLLVAGCVCAGIIHLANRADQT